jgi:hypothetical protein
MRRAAVIAALLVGLGACADLNQQSDMIARETAKNVVNGVLAQRLPGVDARPLTDCVIDNARGDEIIQIAQAALLGVNADTTELVLAIAQRPATVQCIAQRTIGLAGVSG